MQQPWNFFRGCYVIPWLFCYNERKIIMRGFFDRYEEPEDGAVFDRCGETRDGAVCKKSDVTFDPEK